MLVPVPLARFALNATPGAHTLTVNDQPVDAHSVSLLCQPGDVPLLVVRLLGEGVLEGEGIVQVAGPEDGTQAVDVKAAVLAWLDQVDPNELERAALDGMGWGTQTLAEAIVAKLRDAADALA